MENFFYEDIFCSDLSDLIDVLDISDEPVETDEVWYKYIHDLPSDWRVKCEEATLESMFQYTMQNIENIICEDTDRFDDRFPEDEHGNIDKQIKLAVRESVDIDKLNSLIPKLYYPNGKFFEVTKADLIEYCQPAQSGEGGEGE